MSNEQAIIKAAADRLRALLGGDPTAQEIQDFIREHNLSGLTALEQYRELQALYLWHAYQAIPGLLFRYYSADSITVDSLHAPYSIQYTQAYVTLSDEPYPLTQVPFRREDGALGFIFGMPLDNRSLTC